MSFGDLKRWMYSGQRPNFVARVANRMYAMIGLMGLMPNYLVTLEVIGRKSGRKISFPLVVALVDGQRYLASMLGDDAQWVRNVRAANGKASILGFRREAIQLEEIPADQRAPILKVYLRRAPGARPHIPVSKDAPLAEFEKIAARFPVFRIKKA